VQNPHISSQVSQKNQWFPLHQLGVAAGRIRLDISHQLPPFLLQLLAFLLAHLQLTGKIHTAQLGLLAPGRTAIETEFQRRISIIRKK